MKSLILNSEIKKAFGSLIKKFLLSARTNPINNNSAVSYSHDSQNRHLWLHNQLGSRSVYGGIHFMQNDRSFGNSISF